MLHIPINGVIAELIRRVNIERDRLAHGDTLKRERAAIHARMMGIKESVEVVDVAIRSTAAGVAVELRPYRQIAADHANAAGVAESVKRTLSKPWPCQVCGHDQDQHNAPGQTSPGLCCAFDCDCQGYIESLVVDR